MFARGLSLFFQRTLLNDQRRPGPWWLRLAVVSLGFLSLLVASAASAMAAAPGLGLLRFTFLLNLLAVTGFASGYFPAILAEETEEGNFDLLVISGLRPVSLILGKLLARLCTSLLLLAVQTPFLVIAITLGGVLPGHVAQAIGFLLAYTVALAGLGLLCSVSAENTPQAVRRTLPWIGALWLGPLLADLVSDAIPAFQALGILLGSLQPFQILQDLLQAGSDPAAFTQTSVNFALAGLLCGLVAALWLHVRIHLRHVFQDSAGRGPKSRPSVRVQGNPIRWLTLRTRLGGYRAILGYVFAALLLLILDEPTLAVLAFLGVGSISAVHLIGPDAREGSLEALVLLPLRSEELIKGKLSAWVVGILPFVVCCFIAMDQVTMLIILAEAMVFFLFCMLFSTRMRWGAIPAAAALTLFGVNTGLAILGLPAMLAGPIVAVPWILCLVAGILLGQYRRLCSTVTHAITEQAQL